MVEEESGTSRSVIPEPDDGQGAAGSTPKVPGWYPTRTNPNDQTYWDGHDWTARRRWTTGKGWVVAGDAPEGSEADSGPLHASSRLSANPYAPVSVARLKGTGFTFNLGVLLLWICGIALMYGSVGSWIHVTGTVGIADFHVSINGTDPGIATLISVNGWVTFIGGILLVIFACFEMTSDELTLSAFTTVVAAVITIFAIYDMFRIVQKISNVTTSAGSNISVGWGLICVLSAAVFATLITVVRLVQR
ncbi:MAG: hypothetical protein ACLQU9_02190 [Acidimicrobiales bacterium]